MQMDYNDFTNKIYLKKLFELQTTESNDVGGRCAKSVKEHVLWMNNTIITTECSNIVDLGCGIGHYTRFLAEFKHHCVGIDISPFVIDHAIKITAPELNCRFICADILKILLPNRNDLIIAPYSVFNIFNASENQNLFNKIYASLNYNGKFYLEIMTEALPKQAIQYGVWESSGRDFYHDNPYICVTKQSWDIALHRCTCFYYVIDKKTEKYQKHKLIYYRYDFALLSKMLHLAGFQEVQILEKPPGANVDRGLNYLYITASRL
jgi:SAM-dependent methyltransferase